ncbi:LTA synthase family protein [Haploplasma axanthum]|uniref:Lipoteichoic acid synthase n=1 Tax=Haploplasma axanthum TaxID=29552 RepID=A0A449BCA0_HAPAX|nr:alkaline phosphatase family protein [Haploplasma axanthum]VEU80074.1 Lipoteichoic acid synthase [Haploplasma axanthum]
MQEKESKKTYYKFVIAFIVLNVLATYIVTTEALNRYIIAFDYTTMGVINSLIGNIAFLLLVFFLITLVVKKPKSRMFVMLSLTFALNTSLFAINVYNRYYGTSFTFKALSIFRNPSEGFGFTIIYEAIRELVTYYRVILFLPFVVLAIMYFKSKKKGIKELEIKKPTIKLALSKFLLVSSLVVINLGVFGTTIQGKEIIESAKPTYATQNLGLYNYLVLDLMGFDYDTVEVNEENVKDILDRYNKNKDEYTNIIDGKKYSKNVKLSDVENINGQLIDNLNPEDSINGILKDYNLVLVHLETFNHFLLEMPKVNKYLYNLKALLEESYVFNNFHTNVGLGTSFDAELAVLTGLLPNGTSTLSWDFDKTIPEKNFDFQSVPKMFNELGYKTNSFHGNSEQFYNRIEAHPNLFGFNKFNGRDTILKDLGYEDSLEGLLDLKEKYGHDAGMWISDRATFKYFNDKINYEYEMNEKFMSFVITMLPHTPFYYDPYYPNPLETDLYDQEFIKSIDIVTLKYLNYMKYYNEMFKYMFEDVNGYGTDYEYSEDNLYKRKKIAYVFYGDHGSALKANDINTLFNNELSSLEIRQKLLQTMSFIYVPGENTVTKEIDGHTITYREGLLKGEQNLVRGQTDLYRTIVDLFGLPIKDSDYLFGVHGMSTEPTYSIDNKTLDIVTDEFFGTVRNSNSYIIFNNITLEEIERIKLAIIKLKKNSDIAMNNNMYKSFK